MFHINFEMLQLSTLIEPERVFSNSIHVNLFSTQIFNFEILRKISPVICKFYTKNRQKFRFTLTAPDITENLHSGSG